MTGCPALIKDYDEQINNLFQILQYFIKKQELSDLISLATLSNKDTHTSLVKHLIGDQNTFEMKLLPVILLCQCPHINPCVYIFRF